MASRASVLIAGTVDATRSRRELEAQRQPSQRVKPEAKAAEGSLAAPENAKADASRRLSCWQIRRVHEPVETEYSSTAQLAMQGSVEARGVPKAQPEVSACSASCVSRHRQSRRKNGRCESAVRGRCGNRGQPPARAGAAAAAGASRRLRRHSARAGGRKTGRAEGRRQM
jgi:hypothetical protein